MKVLLSIKPIYAERIFAGEKKYEYRKRIFTNETINTVLVYATMPVGKVIGEFFIDDIVEGTPNEIWEKTKESAGIEKVDYLEYFYEKDKGYAISISNPILYDKPKLLKEINENINVAPQSFRYVY